jgi:uncharacterized membrane protein YedE/YeeE
MRTRGAAAAIGVVFGGVLTWSGMSNPNVLRSGLLFEDSYLFLFFGAAVTTAFAGLWLLRRAQTRALLTHEPIAWAPVKPERRHVVGSVVFGAGWGVANVCPGPIATQLGQGIAWSLCTAIGLVIGIVLFGRLQDRGYARAGVRTTSRRASKATSRPPASEASI